MYINNLYNVVVVNITIYKYRRNYEKLQDPVCPKGQVCTTENVSFGSYEVGHTAVCRPCKG